MKYIMFECARGTNDGLVFNIPIIFPGQLVHREVANALIPKLRTAFSECSICVVSAGDFNLSTLECSGESDTLRLKSRGQEDSTLIRIHDIMHGMA